MSSSGHPAPARLSCSPPSCTTSSKTTLTARYSSAPIPTKQSTKQPWKSHATLNWRKRVSGLSLNREKIFMTSTRKKRRHSMSYHCCTKYNRRIKTSVGLSKNWSRSTSVWTRRKSKIWFNCVSRWRTWSCQRPTSSARQSCRPRTSDCATTNSHTSSWMKLRRWKISTSWFQSCRVVRNWSWSATQTSWAQYSTMT